MILEVLDREFVLAEAARIQSHLSEPPLGERRGGANTHEDQDAAHALEIAISRERARIDALSDTVTRRDFPSAPGRPPAPSEPYISGDPVISIVQSALEMYLRDPTTPDAVEDDAVSAEETQVTGTSVLRDNRRILEQFSVTDIGWVSSVVAMGIRAFKDRHAFNPIPARSVTVGDRCRLVVVGDWGSGVPRARKTAESMRHHVVEAMETNLECHVVHLGDVYYSGFEYEYRDRFLPYWPVRLDESDKVGSWCLNGNHDMYSGGHAYFDFLLADSRFSRQQRSSYFRLANSYWQILGLDTAWDDDGLKDPQADWVREQVTKNSLKTMLMSHHQLFSSRDDSADVGKVMREKLKDVLEADKIDAALWGHEHRCVTYEPHAHVKHGRLIGHGGVPVWADSPNEPLPFPGRYQSSKFLKAGLNERFAYMGYAVLDFEGPTINVGYHDENGDLDHSESIE